MTLANQGESSYNVAVYVQITVYSITNRTMRGNDYMSASSKKKLRNEQNAATMTEKQLAEQKEAKKLRNQTIAFVVAVALVITIGLVAFGINAYKASGISERMTTALTVGDHKLSTAELSYYYFDAINSTYQNWYNYYGEYTSTYLSMLYGLDLSKPLNEQIYDKETNKSFADYFIDMAVEDAISAYTLYDLAMEAGHVMDDANKASLEDAKKNLSAACATAGYSSIGEYLKAYYGNGATEKTFIKYLEISAMASSYELSVYNGLSYTADQLNAYSEEHYDEFSSFSYDTFYMNIDDFLLCTASADDKDHKHSEEELDATLKAAQAAADSIVAANPADAEAFNAAIKAIEIYAEKESAKCTENVDMLYSSISNTDVLEWLADSSRKVGDATVITTSTETTDADGNTVSQPYGLTVVVFRGRNDNDMKLVNVRHILNSFTGATTDENGNTVYPTSSIEKSKEIITSLEENWLAGSADEEAFKALAMTNSTDTGSVANGGLYENVYPGQMVTAFNDWCFDESRQPGDHGIVETEYGFHLMYFVGHSAQSFREYMVENTMRNADYEAWYQEQIEAAVSTIGNLSQMRTNITLAG